MLTAGLSLLISGVAHATYNQFSVAAGKADQASGAATWEYGIVAFTQNGPAQNSGPYNAYVTCEQCYDTQPGQAWRINPAGTQAWIGGFDAYRLIYQQVHDGRSQILFYNPQLRAHGAVPARWNSGTWQWSPTAYRHYVLFGRIDRATHRYAILLGDLMTGRLKVLAAVSGAHAYARPGQVNGFVDEYATWTECQDVTVRCDVYEYNITTGQTTMIPNTFDSGGAFQYGSSVDQDGTVYFVHSQGGCGDNVTLNRWDGHTRRVLVFFKPGFDAHQSYVSSTWPTHSESGVYYPRHNCNEQQADLFRIIVEH